MDGPDPIGVEPPKTTEELIQSDWVTEPTRKALSAKLAPRAERGPVFLDDRGFAVLQAAVARLVPQPAGRRAPLAEIIDANLAADRRDGWRYDTLPPDGEAYRLGLQGVDETARCLFACGFVELGPFDQEAVLASIADGWAPSMVWARLPPIRFFEEVLAETVEAYAAHPYGQERMGYRGMADARGFLAVGLDRRDPVDGPDR